MKPFYKVGIVPMLVIMVLCSLAITLAGEKIPVTTSSKEALAEFLEGRTLVDNLRLTDAIPHFQKAVAQDPGFALAHLYLAQTAPTVHSTIILIHEDHTA